MWHKFVSILLVLGMLAAAGCIIAPYPGHHGRAYRHRAVVGHPAPVVVRPGPVVIVP
jgi:hypothetical protein